MTGNKERSEKILDEIEREQERGSPRDLLTLIIQEGNESAEARGAGKLNIALRLLEDRCECPVAGICVFCEAVLKIRGLK